MMERLRPDDQAAGVLIDQMQKRQAVLWLSDGVSRACLMGADVRDGLPDSLPDPLSDALVQARQTHDKAGWSARTQAIFRRFTPRPRFVAVGGDPTALAMGLMALQVGMEVHVVRPKGPAIPPPIPGVHYWRGSPADALAKIALDPWTAVAVATHQDDDDHEALVAALASPASYVGLLGSTRRLVDKQARLVAAGIRPDQMARLKAPIGVPLGGKSPWEIATGVIAEVYQTLNSADPARAVPLRAVSAA
jgi:xanthine dehydrogenase accessory factor